MDYKTIDSEFLQPLVEAWRMKLECSSTAREPWAEVAKECSMFYNQSARAMWDSEHAKKFWKGAETPRFRVTINKAFEMVAIFGPNLFWEVPHRTVKSKKALEIPPEFFGPEGQEVYQQFAQAQAESELSDKVVEELMGRWLNYTPREQPGGGLANHSSRSILDGLITGRCAIRISPYKMPGSGRTLTGAFRVSPHDIYLDPDFQSVDDCRWMAIRHVDNYRDVEKRFDLKEGALKQKATGESNWSFGEITTDPEHAAKRASQQTNDLIVWYEIYSKGGVGINNTKTEEKLKKHMDETVGQYAYIAICKEVAWPLNMPTEKLRRGATDEQVKEAFSWPIPFWADDRWPVEFNDFYTDPDSAYPVAPLAPGLGELKLLNFLVSWFTTRIWKSGRDFYAVAQQHIEHYKEYLESAGDLSIIPTPVGVNSPKEAIEVLSQPETRQDLSKLIDFVSQMFDRRVGLTPTIYGGNENGTQNRTAEETSSKQRAVMARPEYMAKQVVDWQSRIAQSEAFVTRWFVEADDVLPLLGPGGAFLWDQHISSSDVETVVRQFSYTVDAASMMRPNRERDIGNFQQVIGQFAPVLANYGQESGDFGPFNGIMEEWAKLHDADLDSMMLPVPEQPTEEEQMQQEQLQQQAQQLQMMAQEAEVKKTQAEAALLEIEAQIKPLEFQQGQQKEEMQLQAQQAQIQAQLQLEQIKQQTEELKSQAEAAKLQLSAQADQIKMQGEQQKLQFSIQAETAKAVQERMKDEIEHDQKMTQDEELHDQKLRQQEEEARLKLETQAEMARQKLKESEKQARDSDKTGDQEDKD